MSYENERYEGERGEGHHKHHRRVSHHIIYSLIHSCKLEELFPGSELLALAA